MAKFRFFVWKANLRRRHCNNYCFSTAYVSGKSPFPIKLLVNKEVKRSCWEQMTVAGFSEIAFRSTSSSFHSAVERKGDGGEAMKLIL
jgi:hypothetical protein